MKYDSIKKRVDDIKLRVEETIVMFGEDKNQTKPSEFFIMFHIFGMDFRIALEKILAKEGISSLALLLNPK